MLVLEEEQGSSAPGAIERTLLDYASTGHGALVAASLHGRERWHRHRVC